MINFRRANAKELSSLKDIVHRTIRTVYPLYYPDGVVSFFLNHHSEERLQKALSAEYILFAEEDGKILGTGSFHEGEIQRMFVLPDAQGKGIGNSILKELLAYGQSLGMDTFHLDASLPGYGLYEKHGFSPVAYKKLETPGGEYLCYFIMKKTVE